MCAFGVANSCSIYSVSGVKLVECGVDEGKCKWGDGSTFEALEALREKEFG